MNKCIICLCEIDKEISWSSFIFMSNLCKECKSKLNEINRNKCCGYCSYPNMNCCENDLLSNTSIFLGSKFIKELIYKIKFEKDNYLIQVFSDYIKHVVKEKFKDYYAVPVPISKQRKETRKFNQSLEIAKLTDLPILDILERVDNQTQSKKSLKERKSNPPKFRLTMDVNNKKLLLIDDIYTTGTTLRECYKVINKSKTNIVKALTIVRSEK